MSGRVSVVLVADHAGPALIRCLASLIAQSAGPPEVVVADATGEAARVLSSKYVEVRFLVAGAPSSKALLLQRAIDQATGDIVAVTDPACWFPPDWTIKLRQAHDSGFDVVGGAVEYDGAGTVAGWACFLADYGPFLPPVARRVSGALAGNHISYRRSLLPADRYDKTFLLWELERRGVRWLFEPELVIHCSPDAGPLQFARRYYGNAREFAAERTVEFSTATRLAHIASSPALPLVLLLRRIQAVWPKRKHRVRLLQSLPWIAVFVCCWSAGELVGYWRGRRP
jgi:hypothetical protein